MVIIRHVETERLAATHSVEAKCLVKCLAEVQVKLSCAVAKCLVKCLAEVLVKLNCAVARCLAVIHGGVARCLVESLVAVYCPVPKFLALVIKTFRGPRFMVEQGVFFLGVSPAGRASVQWAFLLFFTAVEGGKKKIAFVVVVVVVAAASIIEGVVLCSLVLKGCFPKALKSLAVLRGDDEGAAAVLHLAQLESTQAAGSNLALVLLGLLLGQAPPKFVIAQGDGQTHPIKRNLSPNSAGSAGIGERELEVVSVLDLASHFAGQSDPHGACRFQGDLPAATKEWSVIRSKDGGNRGTEAREGGGGGRKKVNKARRGKKQWQ